MASIDLGTTRLFLVRSSPRTSVPPKMRVSADGSGVAVIAGPTSKANKPLSPNNLEVGIKFLTNGVSVVGSISGRENAEKTPALCATVGTNTSEKNVPGASSTTPEKSSFGELGKGREARAGSKATLVYPRMSIFPLESLAVSFAIELNGMRPGGNGIEAACNMTAEKQNASSSTNRFMADR